MLMVGEMIRCSVATTLMENFSKKDVSVGVWCFSGAFQKRTYHPVNDHMSHPWKVRKMDINSKVPNGMGYVIVSRVG